MRVCVVGAAGYAGGELLRLILGHPEVFLAFAPSARVDLNKLHECRGFVEALIYDGDEQAGA